MIRLKSLLTEQVQLTPEQEAWLNKCINRSTNSTWSADNLGYVTVKGDFDCSQMMLTDFLKVKFAKVTGKFNCYQNNLISLEGAPTKVLGNFNCSNNMLTSLKGAPNYVGGSFYCYNNNNLKSLEGVPQTIGGKMMNADFIYPTKLGTPDQIKQELKNQNVTITGDIVGVTTVGTTFRADSREKY